MARKQCKNCGQFAGVGHKCKPIAVAVPAAVEIPKAASAASPLSPSTMKVAGSLYKIPLAPGEARQWVSRLSRAVTAPADASGAAVVAEDRAAAEARFGPIDWRS